MPPFFESFGKRLVKSPKLYLLDPGLAAFLLGIESEHDLARSPFLGPLFEGFVASGRPCLWIVRWLGASIAPAVSGRS